MTTWLKMYIKSILFFESLHWEKRWSSFLFVFLFFRVFLVVFILLLLFIRLVSKGSCSQFRKPLYFIILGGSISAFEYNSGSVSNFKDKRVFFVIILDDISWSDRVFNNDLHRSIKKLFPALTVTSQSLYLGYDLLLLFHFASLYNHDWLIYIHVFFIIHKSILSSYNINRLLMISYTHKNGYLPFLLYIGILALSSDN